MNKPTRIVDLNAYYRAELKRLDKAMDEARAKYGKIKTGIQVQATIVKAAELNQAIRAGSYYREKIVAKIIETT